MQKYIIILLIFLYALSSCASKVTIKKVPSGTSLTSLGKNVLIFGRIRWIENGKVRERFSGLYGDFNVDLQILRVDNMKRGTIFEIEKDGSFFAMLPKGTYIIHMLDWADFWGSGQSVSKVAFKVSEARHSYYLGTLVVNMKTERNILGSYMVKGLDIYVEDEEIEAMKAFYKRYPPSEVNVVKALMVHDPSIPRIDEFAKQRALINILNSLQFGLMPTLYP